MKKTYKIFSVFFFTTVILLIFLNIVALPFLNKTGVQKEEYKKFILDSLLIEDVYKKEGFNSEYINSIMNDFANHSFNSPSGQYCYFPRSEYVESLFSSQSLNINVEENNINNRTYKTEAKRNGCKYHIYCFGGSTTFGALVADGETWPASLEKALGDDFCVKNYGVSGYTATQETDLFISLLKLGHRPSLVIFMDGVNTGPSYDGADISNAISSRFNQQETNLSFGRIISELPIIQLLNSSLTTNPLGDEDNLEPMELPEGKYNDMMVSRFIENSIIRKSIANVYSTEIIQLMQPNVFVKYDFQYLNDFHRRNISKETIQNYQYMYKNILKSDTSFIDYSNLFDEYGKPALVDGIHYSPGFNDFIAVKLASLVMQKQIKPYSFLKNEATGEPF